MRRTGRLRRRTPLAQQSRRKREGIRSERDWREAVFDRDRWCQAAAHGLWHDCGGPFEAHHLAQRSVRPDLVLDVANGITLCRNAHRWVHDHESEMYDIGLLRHSWEAS